MDNKIYVALIPALDPSEKLTEIVDGLVKNDFKVIVVNDGSAPEYNEVFNEIAPFATVLIHDKNEGKGCALKTGLRYISENFSTDAVVVTLDADGQHQLEDVMRVCRTAEHNRESLILGCRQFGSDVPKRSRAGNLITRNVFRLLTGVNVSDTQTGLRAFSNSLTTSLMCIKGSRYEYEMNMLLECSQNDIPIKEVKIETVYFDNNSASHFDTIKDSFLIYHDIFKFAASSFIGFLVDYGVYAFMTLITGGLSAAVSIPLSNITARAISSGVNYTLNRKYVFRNKDSVAKTAIKYFSLVIAVLIGNTLLLTFLTQTLGVNKYAAKIITELTFFSINWVVQRFLIFNRKNSKQKYSYDNGQDMLTISQPKIFKASK